jgi:hypothetical protein
LHSCNWELFFAWFLVVFFCWWCRALLPHLEESAILEHFVLIVSSRCPCLRGLRSFLLKWSFLGFCLAQTMLDEHRTPRRYWAEAVNTACHVGTRFFWWPSWTRRSMSSCTGEHLEWPISGLLVVDASFSRRVGLISLSRGLPMGFSWVMLVILEHFVCSTLILT